MNEFVQKLVDYVIAWFETRPPETWLGVVIFALSVVIVIAWTAWRRKKFFKDTTEKLSTKITLLNVGVFSALTGALGWIVDSLTTGSQILGPFIPAEYLAQVSKIAFTAVTAHSLVTKILKWWLDRKAGKPITLPTPETPAVVAPQPISPDVWAAPTQK